MNNHQVSFKFIKILILFVCSFYINFNEVKKSYGSLSIKNNIDEPSQNLEFVKFNLLFGQKLTNQFNDYLLGLEVNLLPKWKIYWKNPGDAGLPPEISWKNASNVDSVSLLYPMPKRFIFFDIQTFGYENEVVFPLEIKLIDKEKKLSGFLDLNAQICSEICVPITQKFDLNKLNFIKEDTTSFKKIINYKNKIPKRVTKEQLDLVSINIHKEVVSLKFKNYAISSINDVIIEDENGFINYKPEILGNNDNLNIKFNKINKEINPQILKLTFLTNDIGYETTFDNLNDYLLENPSVYSLGLQIIFIAFVGGLILNFMPCVLPVLSLKMVQLVSYRTESVWVFRKKLLFNILGILTTFLLLSILAILIKSTGDYVGWGIQFQSPYFLVFMILLTCFFAFNLFGVFHYFLPSKVLSFLSYNKDGYLGDFVTGVFLTFLATPCTAPLVGTAIGFALSGNILEIFSILLVMGVGLSLPLILLLFFPSIIKIIPKPGNWLNTFKKIMGFLLLLTSIWLMSILYSLLISTNPLSNVKKEDYEIRWDIEKNLLYPSQLAKEGEIVFVDITADWCITCKVNKNLVLNNPEIVEMFSKNNVKFLQLDWTKPNDKIKEFLALKNRYGLPYNEIYSSSIPNGKILPEILSKKIVKEFIDMAK
ncbi:MAG: thioredoxin family protein [Alphaproteobacteria bacterium]|jgi:suppressor for copper-sensitivity B|nr:thioredoxin family protein [Alphaproteobacteria bacterium]MBL6850527.1 thioredoxin family protein [Alphaproteobacteria bacterium]